MPTVKSGRKNATDCSTISYLPSRVRPSSFACTVRRVLVSSVGLGTIYIPMPVCLHRLLCWSRTDAVQNLFIVVMDGEALFFLFGVICEIFYGDGNWECVDVAAL